MAKIKVTKQDIYDAVSLIIAAGLIPTHDLLKSKLRQGSDTTIHKYFKQWKRERLFGGQLKNKSETIIHQSLEEEKKSLKHSLDKQISKNENYAQELIDAEKANITLKEKIHQLESDITKLQCELIEITAVKNNLEQINKEIQNKVDINSNETIQKMQQNIDDLRLELKTLNESSINALRETSNQGHEALMQERVVSINLQAKIDNLTKEFLESKKQLNETIMTSQVRIRSLSRQNEELQKIIQEHGLDRLLNPEEGASLKSTNGVAAYAK